MMSISCENILVLGNTDFGSSSTTPNPDVLMISSHKQFYGSIAMK